MRKIPAPSDLETAGRKCWRQVLSVYVLSDSELILLHQICAVLDRLTQIGAEIARKGVVRPDGGLSALVAEERLQRGALATLLKQLSLPVEDETESGQTLNFVSADAPVRIRDRRGRGA